METKILLFAALLPVITYAVEPTDTTIIVNNKKVVINDSSGDTNVKIFDLNGNEESKTFEGRYINGQDIEQIYITSPFIPEKKKYRNYCFNSHYPLFFMGFNEIPGSFLGTSGNSDMHTKDSKSWEFGFTLFSASLSLNQQKTFGITSAFQISRIFNHFSGNYVMTTNNNTGLTSIEIKDNKEIKKSYISYTSIRIPIMLEWQHKYGSNKAYAAFGTSIELRYNEHSNYYVGNEKFGETSDINLNPIGINLQINAGYGSFMLYMRSAITPLLNSDKAPKCYPFAFGIGIRL